ncbi:TetR/AcrR family transcriptional regulator [Agromyces archimandritae]|uniref:TetR/AcrR family transcriptional regulator n=1 Tax=Agromyces archimandritae TaxID=2781962 RepID=UPI001FD398A6|nr:helix-turn-helix domain-containing protein [Agromyces archimandritae]
MPTTRKTNRGPSAGPANRAALIAAAREIFASEGLNAPLNAVARRAGVGQGSLYRHFPERIDLAVAVFDENLDALETASAAVDAGLDELLDRVIERTLVSTAFIDMVSGNQHDARVAHLGERMQAIVAAVVDRERAAGRIGDHVATEDVLLAITMLAEVLARTDAADRDAVGRRAWSIFHAAFAPRGE